MELTSLKNEGFFRITLDLTLDITPAPGTKIQDLKNLMGGADICVGGYGIKFKARGVLTKATGDIKRIEMGFLQSICSNTDYGEYGLPNNSTKYMTKFFDNYPVKDGEPGSIWYKPESSTQAWSEPQVGAPKIINFKTSDEVKSSYPTTKEFNNAIGTLQEIYVDRVFHTCVALHLTRRRAPPVVFYLESVIWHCASIVPRFKNEYLNADKNFYNVLKKRDFYNVLKKRKLENCRTISEILVDEPGPGANTLERTALAASKPVGAI